MEASPGSRVADGIWLLNQSAHSILRTTAIGLKTDGAPYKPVHIRPGLVWGRERCALSSAELGLRKCELEAVQVSSSLTLACLYYCVNYYFIFYFLNYLFIFGCVGSSLLHAGFL